MKKILVYAICILCVLGIILSFISYFSYNCKIQLVASSVIGVAILILPFLLSRKE